MTLLAMAMRLYPGGTAFDPAAPGHSFWFNFLCDLTNGVAVNGRPNPVGSEYARAAMLALAVALASFWIILPALFHSRRRLAFATCASGLLSVGGLVAVPVADGFMHVVAVFASSVPALVAGTLGIIGMMRISPRTSNLLPGLALATVAAALADSVLYARSYMVVPRIILPVLPLFQRLALLLMLSWMTAVALHILRSGRRAAPD